MRILKACGRFRELPLACALLLLAHSTAAAPILVVDVDRAGATGPLAVGEILTVMVRADDIPAGSDGNGLFGFGFRIAYDDSVLSASAPVIDSQWTGSSGIQLDAGDVGATSNRLGSSSGPFDFGIELATILFEVIAPGAASLELGLFTGIGDNLLFDGTVLDADPAFLPPPVQVPEPALAGLLLLGAAVLAGLGGRR